MSAKTTTGKYLRLEDILWAGGFACLFFTIFSIGSQIWVDYRGTQTLRRMEHERPKKQAAPSRRLTTGELIGKVEVAGRSTVILEGVSEDVLRLAVGHVPGTALPGQRGRIALAGHRDSFFRGLRNVKPGAPIRLIGTRGNYDYEVVATEIVKPEDTRVLRPTPDSLLTLITCYPFHYLGNAPLRFVVHAKPKQRVRPAVLAMHSLLQSGGPVLY